MSRKPTTPEELGVEQETAPDDVFGLLVHVANTSDLEMNVTLHVHGQLVTGKLISGATYWAESARDLRRGAEGSAQLVKAMAASMDRVAQKYRAAYVGDTDGEPGATTAFVHLRDARTITAQGPVPRNGALWRGRLASVDGFSLGELRSGDSGTAGGGRASGVDAQRRAAAKRGAAARRRARRAVAAQRRAIPDRSAARSSRGWVG